MEEFTYNDISQPNRNKLLYQVQGADGLKTGFTKESGWGIAATALRNDRRITECKDINDMIMSGLSESEVVEIINRNTVKGLSAKLQLMEYKKT